MSDVSLESIRIATYELGKKLNYFRRSITVPQIDGLDKEASLELSEKLNVFGKLLRNYINNNFPPPEVDSNEIVKEVENYINGQD